MRRCIITLLTDFGDADGYAAAMKGVILGINERAVIVDVTHGIRPQGIREASLALLSSCPFFPAGAIHVAVVDPGVGSARLSVAVEAGGHFFVGPDNGLLFPVCSRMGVSSIHAIEKSRYLMPEMSSTFHGRDIFAPAAAHLSRGVNPARLGRRLERMERLVLPEPAMAAGPLKRLNGEVVHVDRFGNLVTNVSRGHLADLRDPRIRIAGRSLPLSDCYSDAEPGKLLAYVGSLGFVEIAANRGSAASVLRRGLGARVELREGRRI